MVEYKSHHLDQVFHALADPTRRSMLGCLAARELTVSELAAPFDMSLAGASKHVQVLVRAGLIFQTKEGRTQVCRLNPKPLAEARDWMRFYEKFWNERLDALEQALRQADAAKGDSNDG